MAVGKTNDGMCQNPVPNDAYNILAFRYLLHWRRYL